MQIIKVSDGVMYDLDNGITILKWENRSGGQIISHQHKLRIQLTENHVQTSIKKIEESHDYKKKHWSHILQ